MGDMHRPSEDILRQTALLMNRYLRKLDFSEHNLNLNPTCKHLNESALVYKKSSPLLQAAMCHAHSALLY